jgi:hypothetical protein
MENLDFVPCVIALHFVIQCPILDFDIKVFDGMEGKMVPSKSARWGSYVCVQSLVPAQMASITFS